MEIKVMPLHACIKASMCHSYVVERGVSRSIALCSSRRIFLGLTFWPKGIFLGLWKAPGFFWVAKTTEGFFLVLYFSSAQIKNNISASYSVVFDQNQSWSWHVLAFQKINNKICWCKNTEGFFWVDKFWSWDFFGYKIWTSVGPPRH